MPRMPLGMPCDGLTCPRCQSADVLEFCALRSSVLYLCDCCEHRWEVSLPSAAGVAETTTVRTTVSTGYGADHHRLTPN